MARTSGTRNFCTAVAAAGIVLLAPGVCTADSSPWRVDTVLGLPPWLSISGQHRTRFENLDNQFRLGRGGGDQVLVFRTNVLARLTFTNLSFAAEMLDAREAFADRGTSLSTSVVNPIDLLQAWMEVPLNDLFQAGSRSTLKVGRMTMDVGSRRLVARNRFRNTINAFTGADWQWTGAGGSQVRFFYTLPVQRRAGDDLLHADAELDEESDRIRFWGAYFAPGALPWGDKGELYLFGLDEHDSPEFATLNRSLYTTGFRLYREPAAGRLDYELESVYQFGTSRATTSPADTRNLDHFALFQHGELGYSFNLPWKPRIIAQFDYASGDDDPDDGDNNRFDTLFGARRFDFGPTGIYGPFARANLSSPGVRLKFAPGPELKAMTALRGFWLASDTDAWTTAGVRDPSGRSGSYIGTQIEAQLQWAAIPDNLEFEVGLAHIFGGEVMRAPPGNGNGDPTYFYLQTALTF